MKIKFLIFLMLALSLSAGFALSTDSKEHFSSVGNKFISVNGNYFPEIFTLFDNTNIYVDINSDGVYDYQFNQDFNKTLTVNTAWKIKTGSTIITDKPVILAQKLYDETYYKNYIYVPPVTNFKEEYFLMNSPYNVISDKDTRIIVQDLTSQKVDVEYEIKAFENTTIYFGSTAKLTADNPVLVWNSISLASIPGNDFVVSGTNMIILSEKDQTIKVDYNNDEIYDESIDIVAGANTLATIIGSRIHSSTKISIFENIYDRVYYKTIAPVYPFSYLSSEGYYKNYLLKEFAYYVFNNTDLNLKYELLDYDVNISEKVELQKSFEIYVANKPVMINSNYAYYHSYRPCISCNMATTNYVQSNPYPASAKIESLVYTKKKYLKTNNEFNTQIRIFNSFFKTSASNLNLRVDISYPFSNFQTYSAYVEKKQLHTDNVIDSANFILTPVNSALSLSGSIFSELDEQQYLDITLKLLSPQIEGTYNVINVDVDYQIPVWSLY